MHVQLGEWGLAGDSVMDISHLESTFSSRDLSPGRAHCRLMVVLSSERLCSFIVFCLLSQLKGLSEE